MPFCRNCGKQLEENVKFCPECGSAQENASEAEAAPTPPVTEIPTPPKASGILNVGQLIWSILNLIFCCMPLAIVSLIMTVTAKDAPSAEEETKKLKTAKTCNLIATIGSAVFFVIYFAFVVIMALIGEGVI